MSGPGPFLRLLEDAASAADQCTTIEEAAARVLPELCAVTGWRAGALVEAGDDVGADAGDDQYQRFPVRLGDEVVAWLAFSTSTSTGEPVTPGDEWVALVDHVGRQLARVVERARSEQRYSALVESVHDAVLTTDGGGVITAANAAAVGLLGCAPHAAVGRPVADVLPPEIEVTAVEQTTLILRRSGSKGPDQLHDPLTGLANRVLLRDRLEHALAGSGRRGSSVAVMAVDLDRFKTVNDTYGPSAGDGLLMAVASRLQGAVRSGDTVGRVGGDEFAIVCEDVAGEAEAMALVANLLDAFKEPFSVEGRDLAVTPTVGIAFVPAEGVEAGQLLRDAAVARERAHHRGLGEVAVFDESMRAAASERLSVEHDLRAAISDGQLRLHYQPIIDLDTRSVSGVEALVRWEHPTRGLLLPEAFIGPAEESGLIVPLGRWVLEQACRQGALWQRGHRGLRVSVNVSAREFRQETWADEVAEVLSESGFPPGELVLEITESMLMEDIDTTRARLTQLQHLGVRIAIDDFGTGYSSLGYLRQLPVDILKVDKTFIDGVAQGPHESALARAVIKLAATLNLDAVAEGVDSHSQYAQLRRLHCRFGQGYFFSPALPPEGLGAIIAADSFL